MCVWGGGVGVGVCVYPFFLSQLEVVAEADVSCVNVSSLGLLGKKMIVGIVESCWLVFEEHVG